MGIRLVLLSFIQGPPKQIGTRAGIDKPAVLTLEIAGRTTSKKALVNHEGLFSYFVFFDEDLMRSSSFKNSAVSSSIDLEGGLGGKGITSDMGRTSLGTRPRRISFSPAIAAFLRRTFLRWLGIRHNKFQFCFSLPEQSSRMVLSCAVVQHLIRVASCVRPPASDHGSISTPGFIMPFGSSSRLAPRSARANSSGRCLS